MIRIVAVVTLIAIFGTKVHCQGMAGMGGMAGMRAMAGMGGSMGSMASMGGMAGMGGMMRSMLPVGLALGGDLSAREFMTLDNAVKAIMGPNATPSPALIILAAQQGGMPITATGMLPYMALMQASAREQNMTIPGVLGQPTKDQLDNYIMEKTMQWVQQRTMYGTMTENPDVIMRLQGFPGSRGSMAEMSGMSAGMDGPSGMGGRMPGSLTHALLARQPGSGFSQNPLLSMMTMGAMGMDVPMV